MIVLNLTSHSSICSNSKLILHYGTLLGTKFILQIPRNLAHEWDRPMVRLYDSIFLYTFQLRRPFTRCVKHLKKFRMVLHCSNWFAAIGHSAEPCAMNHSTELYPALWTTARKLSQISIVHLLTAVAHSAEGP
jgi:hypothetical protein